MLSLSQLRSSKLYVFSVHICCRVDCMKVLEAAELLVEILKKCNLKGSTIALMPPRPYTVTMAQGYKLHLTILKRNREAFSCIENLVKEHGLSYFEDRRGLMIYRER